VVEIAKAMIAKAMIMVDQLWARNHVVPPSTLGFRHATAQIQRLTSGEELQLLCSVLILSNAFVSF
jgi:hypothetical protein